MAECGDRCWKIQYHVRDTIALIVEEATPMAGAPPIDTPTMTDVRNTLEWRQQVRYDTFTLAGFPPAKYWLIEVGNWHDCPQDCPCEVFSVSGPALTSLDLRGFTIRVTLNGHQYDLRISIIQAIVTKFMGLCTERYPNVKRAARQG